MSIGSLPETVRDVKGGRFTLVRDLGAGTQGAVYATDDGRFAVKVVEPRGAADGQRLARQLRQVKIAPLQDLRIARPLELLDAPLVGYVMELIDDPAPLSPLLRQPANRDVAEWWVDTGGLRRRYEIAMSILQTLSALHGLGLVYVDLSPNNVLIQGQSDVAWLIDSDNVRAESSVADSFYTRGWSAPELMRGTRPASSLTDVWSGGVLTFHLLTLTHPFIGDAVHDGAAEMEDDALSGELPWIDDDDPSNRSSMGFPREIVLTPGLRRVFDRLFSGGRLEPARRPGTSELYREVTRASRRLTDCDDCRTAFLLSSDRACPFCAAVQGPRVLGRLSLWQSLGERHVDKALDDFVVLEPGRSTPLPAALLAPQASPLAEGVEMEFSDGRISILVIGDLEVRERTSGQAARQGQRLHFPIEADRPAELEFGPFTDVRRRLLLGLV